MISYMQCIDHAIMVKEALSFMTLHGDRFHVQDAKMGGTEINFTNSQILIIHEGLQIGHIESLINLRLRMSVPKHLSFATFYTQTEDNNIGEIKKQADSLYTDTSEEIELVPQVSQEEWDAVAFQLGTMYDDKIVAALMLEPFCTSELCRYYPNKHFRFKQYTISDSWVDLPFEFISQNIFEMCSRYIPEYTTR